MPMPSSFYPRVFALIVAAVLGYALILIFAPFIRPIAWAAFLAFLLYPAEPSPAAPLPRPGCCGRRSESAGADRHPFTFERLVDRVRRANFRLDPKNAEIRSRTRHQVAVGSAAISLDRPHQWLAGVAYGDFRGANSIVGGLRHARGAEGRGQHRRRVFSGCLGIAAGICDHAVSVVLFLARRGCAAAPRCGA